MTARPQLPPRITLPVPALRMRDMPAEGNHCVPTAFSAVLSFAANATSLPDAEQPGPCGTHDTSQDPLAVFAEIFPVVKASGYHRRWGVPPWRIARALQRSAEQVGLRVKRIRSRYLWSVQRQIFPHLAAGRPVIMNIGWGKYRQHTVAVCGYHAAPENGSAPLLLVNDGWTGRREIWNPRNARLFGIGPYIASFTTLEV